MTPIIDSFESERLLFEARSESHAAELYEHLCEKDLYLYTMRDVPPSLEWLAQGLKKLESPSLGGKELWLGWIGREKTTRKAVGIFEITLIDSVAFIAYTVSKESWGKGYATEASKAMMDYMTCKYPVRKFIIEMDTRNRASTKVAEKLGFDFVKVINNATFIKNFVSHEFQFQKLV